MAELQPTVSGGLARPGANDAPAPKINMRLDAFKKSVETSKNARLNRFQERRSESQKLSDQLRSQEMSEDLKEAVKRNYYEQTDKFYRAARQEVTIQDFDLLKVIGTGAFGIVRLCRHKGTGDIRAMKQMSKKEMVYKNQVHHVQAERDALCAAKDDWVAGLHYTFQDDSFLYMVMDYLPGGDLMTHLTRKDTFTEDETRFYVAELVEAIDYIHTNLHYIHRDIKPDNIVFNKEGHIRLLDFGLCKYAPPVKTFSSIPEEGEEEDSIDSARSRACQPSHPPRDRTQSVVGTPDYMGPEVYRKESYGKECDMWSLGIIMFEMLFGGPPFSDEKHEPAVTSKRVMHWRKHFQMPPDPGVSEEARSLIRGLICDPEERLTADQIRAHPFFKGLDFKNLRNMDPPIKPVVNGPLDTSNFDDFGVDNTFEIPTQRHKVTNDGDAEAAFHGYGYRRDLEGQKPSVDEALRQASVTVASVLSEAKPETHVQAPARASLPSGPQHLQGGVVPAALQRPIPQTFPGTPTSLSSGGSTQPAGVSHWANAASPPAAAAAGPAACHIQPGLPRTASAGGYATAATGLAAGSGATAGPAVPVQAYGMPPGSGQRQPLSPAGVPSAPYVSSPGSCQAGRYAPVGQVPLSPSQTMRVPAAMAQVPKSQVFMQAARP